MNERSCFRLFCLLGLAVLWFEDPMYAQYSDSSWHCIGPPPMPRYVVILGFDGPGNILVQPGYDATGAAGVYRFSGDSSRPIGFDAAASFAGRDPRGRLYVAAGGGIYWSTDNGKMWTYSVFSPVSALAFDPAGYIFAATNDGVYRSDTNGISWQKLPAGIWHVSGVGVTSKGIVFATTWSFGEGSIFRSTDKGLTWELKDSGIPGAAKDIETMFVDRHDAIFVGTYYSAVYRSTDGGESYAQLSLAGWQGHLSYDSLYDEIFADASQGILRSRNQGSNWSLLPLTAGTYSLVTVNPGGVLYATSGSSFLRYTGARWDTLTQAGFPLGGVWALAQTPDGDLVLSTDNGLLRSVNGGASWNVAAVWQGGISQFSCNAQGLFFRVVAAYGSGEDVQESSDGGTSWQTVFYSSSGGTRSIPRREGAPYLYGPFGIGISTDDGNSWSTIAGPGTLAACAVAADGRLLAAANNDVYSSTNLGASWNQLHLEMPVSSIATDSTGDLCTGSAYGAFRSLDGGTTWSQTFMRGDEFAQLMGDADSSFKAIIPGLGVWESRDHGSHWHAINNGLPVDDVTFIARDHSGGLFAGTRTHGVFLYGSSRFATSVRRQYQAALPLASVVLFSNYPNPFNPTTTIKYELSAAAKVNLCVYDILGREVSVLVNERLNAGSYQVTFDASRMASGTYIYRLKTGDYVSSKLMLVIK